MPRVAFGFTRDAAVIRRHVSLAEQASLQVGCCFRVSVRSADTATAVLPVVFCVFVFIS
jgi:hypothetical protein